MTGLFVEIMLDSEQCAHEVGKATTVGGYATIHF